MMDDYSSVSLEGDMSIPRQSRVDAPLGAPDFNTLDEPIKETIVSEPKIILNVSLLEILILMLLFLSCVICVLSARNSIMFYIQKKRQVYSKIVSALFLPLFVLCIKVCLFQGIFGVHWCFVHLWPHFYKDLPIIKDTMVDLNSRRFLSLCGQEPPSLPSIPSYQVVKCKFRNIQRREANKDIIICHYLQFLLSVGLCPGLLLNTRGHSFDILPCYFAHHSN